jgi:hypothetical protein
MTNKDDREGLDWCREPVIDVSADTELIIDLLVLWREVVTIARRFVGSYKSGRGDGQAIGCGQR